MANRTGNSGANTLLGTSGNDSLSGLGGNDRLEGRGGNDTLNGGTGIDRLFGGAGNDIYIIDNATEIDKPTDDAGIDTVQSSVTYSLGAQQEHLTLTGAAARNGTGNAGANTLTGNNAANQLSGLNGNDLLKGNGGNDTLLGGGGVDNLQGGAGNDTLNGNAGNDRLLGGDGADTLIFDAADLINVDGGGGTDTLKVQGAGLEADLVALNATTPVFKSIEIVDLSAAGTQNVVLDEGTLLALSGSDALRIKGTAVDAVQADGLWATLADTVIGTVTYHQFQSGTALLQVQDGVDTGGIAQLAAARDLSALDGTDGFQISGISAGDRSGYSVSDAGDVNGDGFGDLLIGAYKVDANGYADSGASYVVFGGAGTFPSNLELSTLNGTNGFQLTGEALADHSGFSVSAVGDVNGDGFGDLLIGARGADPFGSYSGAGYLVFGAAGAFSAEIDLSSLSGSSGFRIDSSSNYDRLGTSVSAAGDVNGDGWDDLVIGAPGAPNGTGNGSAYVFFGSAGLSSFVPVRVNGLDGFSGFALAGDDPNDSAAISVSGAGDVNADGIDDLIVGADKADPNGTNSGASYVVFGTTDGFSSAFELSALNGTNGFVISGEAQDDYSGISVSGAGDVNGDGIGDLIVGAYYADPNGALSGAAYVIFGAASGFSSSLNLSALDGANGFRIRGAAAGDLFGVAVSGAGDIDGDGFDDLIIGAAAADAAVTDGGISYVVFGDTTAALDALHGTDGLDVSSLNGANGFAIRGAVQSDFSGASVSGAGDLNGDGFADLVIGAPYADAGGVETGVSYVLYGRDFRDHIAAEHQGTAAGDTLTGSADSELLIGGLGDDTLDGAGGNDVLIGGSGNDVLIFDSADSLRVNGGPGTDALRVTDATATLNLVTLNVSEYYALLQGIEVIDLSGSAANTVTLDARSLRALSETGNTLRVIGDEGDAVATVGDQWVRGANVEIDGTLHAVYTQGSATLQVEVSVDRSGIAIDLSESSLATLDGVSGFRISGEFEGGVAGDAVSSAGDVNGDGFDDLIIGARFVAANGTASGASYVVFGAPEGPGADLDLSALNGANGFQISGEAAGHNSGDVVSSAGDVNGDGFADLIIGANFGGSTGYSYVVFGKSGSFSSNLDLSALNGTNGFQITGEAASDFSGAAVSGAGDMNGDGIDDVAISAILADPNGISRAGATYVVFGKASGFASELNLSALDGTNGLQISGEVTYDQSGNAVSAAGDVNGDGFEDLLIGAYRAGPNGGGSGASYVVFGGSGGFASNLDLSSLNGTNGFQISGETNADFSGYSVSGAGDVNGDGIGDLLVGARTADPNGSKSGASYVVFGKNAGFMSNLDLSSLDGSNGFQISGEATDDYAGVSVSAAGDFNGDGFDDLLIGAYGADPAGSLSGATYLVFGQAGAFVSEFQLSALDGSNGFRINGEAADDASGKVVSGAGDVDGDGFDDLLIGARTSDANGNNSGAAYVLLGGDIRDDVDYSGTSGDDTLTGTGAAEIFVGGLGNDVIDGAGGDDVMTGGVGNDVFRFNVAPGAEVRILDFEARAGDDDRVELDNDIFTSLATAANAVLGAAEFKANATGTATDTDDRIIYNTITGEIFYDADGSDGGSGNVLIAVLKDAPDIDATDLFIID